MVQAAGTTGNSGLNVVERAVLAAASAPEGTCCPRARARHSQVRGLLPPPPDAAHACRHAALLHDPSRRRAGFDKEAPSHQDGKHFEFEVARGMV
jgi:hypothetical protein